MEEITVIKENGKSIPSFVEIDFPVNCNHRRHMDAMHHALYAYAYFLEAQGQNIDTEDDMRKASDLLKKAKEEDNTANLILENADNSKEFFQQVLLGKSSEKASRHYITYTIEEYGCDHSPFEWVRGNADYIAKSIAEYILMLAEINHLSSETRKHFAEEWTGSPLV